eukprot:1146830-Pelagomonas_calceolata.AAC.3
MFLIGARVLIACPPAGAFEAEGVCEGLVLGNAPWHASCQMHSEGSEPKGRHQGSKVFRFRNRQEVPK